jgi:protein TonB
MKALIFVLSVLMASTAISQSEEYPFPDEDTEFPGGASEMKKFIATQIQYPEVAIRNGDQGRVYVSFVVGPDGQLSNIKIDRGVTPELDAEAIRVVSSMPRWIPGKSNGENIPVFCRLPIIFTINVKTSRKARREYRKRMK